MTYNITLKYDGNNSVDATDLSVSLLNFAKLIQKTSKDYLDDKQMLKVDICAFNEWSLDALTALTVRDTIKSTSIAMAPVLPQIIATTVDIIELWKFLRWLKAKKVSSSKAEPWKVIITNQQWDVATFSQKSYIHIWDTAVNYYVTQYVSPTKNDERLSGQAILDNTWNPLVTVSKEEASYFEQTEELIKQEVSLIWKIYDMNTETMNGKIDVWWLKISISFKKVYEKQDFWNLVKSLKYKAAIKIWWEALVDINSSAYKNIDVLTALLLQDTLFEEDD